MKGVNDEERKVKRFKGGNEENGENFREIEWGRITTRKSGRDGMKGRRRK